MKFIVCIKQVPDVSAPLFVRDGELVTQPRRFVLNAYDASALEAALVVTERMGGQVHLVLLGPRSARATILKALAMGAGSASHLEVEAELDSRACAGILAGYLRHESYDVVACGKQAQDTDAGLTGPMLAEMLRLPYATNVVGLGVEPGRLVVSRQGDVGKEIVVLSTPCLVTCSNDMNDPRIPGLKGIMEAKRKMIDVRPVDPPSPGSYPATRVVSYEPAPARRPGRILEGDLDTTVTDLVRLLENESRVL